MARVSRLETVSYNGFTFPVESKCDFACAFVKDQADRTTVYVKYTITVTSTIAETDLSPGTTNEVSVLPALRRRLSKQGQALRITGLGFGDLSVNNSTVNSKRDVRWGPTPRLVRWTPLGTKACRVVWVCDVHVPECEDEGGSDTVTPTPSTSEGEVVTLTGGGTPGGDPDLSRTGGGGTVTLTGGGVDPGGLAYVGKDKTEGAGWKSKLPPVAGAVAAAVGGVADAAAAAAAEAAAQALDLDRVAGFVDDGDQFGGRLLAYNFTVSVSKDDQGYLVRTVSGYLEIPMTRPDGGGRTMPDTADAYWDEQTAPPIPKGFRRGPVQTSLSEDKRRLNFSVTDTEMPEEMLPPFVLECRASHTETAQGKALRVFVSTIRASYTLKKGVPKRYAWKLFLLLIAYRIARQRTNSRIQGFIPLSLTAEDPDVYGRSAAGFSFTYRFVLPPTPALANRIFGSLGGVGGTLWNGGPNQSGPAAALLAAAGVAGAGAPGVVDALDKVRDTAYQRWAQSLKDVMGPRGALGHAQTKSDDLIIDLCENLAPKAAGDRLFRVKSSFSEDTLKFDVPVGDGSLLRYDVRLVVESDSGEAPVRPLASAASAAVAGAAPDAAPGGLPPGAAKLGVAAGAAVGDFFIPGAGGLINGLAGALYEKFKTKRAGEELADHHQRSAAECFCRLEYDIIQVGVLPAAPVLTGVGNLTSRQIIHEKTVGAQSEVGELMGAKLYRQTGKSFYRLRVAPGTLPSVPPDFYIDGSPIGQRPTPALGGAVGYSL